MSSTLNEISQIIKQHISILKKQYYVKTIGIFGSFVRGEENSESNLVSQKALKPEIGKQILQEVLYL